MLQDIPLPFGEWLPDLGENENPGLVEAKNVIARPGGYAPIGAVSAGSALAPASALSVIGSAFGYISSVSSGTRSFDYGVQGGLYANNNLTSVSSTSSTVSPWRFAQFDNRVFAVNEGNAAASTSSNLWQHDVSSTTYSNVAVSGLRGRSIARIGQFLMLGGCNDIIGSSVISDYLFRWSAFNNPTSWAVSQTTQAGQASVNEIDHGPITGIVGGRYGILFQSFGVSRIDYVGPPKVWNESVISRGRGCVVPRSIVTLNDITYFFAHDGVCATNGVGVERIGLGRVDDWVQAALAVAGPLYVTAGILPDYQSIMWSFGGVADASLDLTDTFIAGLHLIYNTETGRFTYAEVNTGGMVASAVPLRSYFSAPNATGYVINIGGDPISAAALGGSNLAAEVTTGYTSLTPGRRIAINNVEPVYDGSGAKVAVNTKATQAGAATLGTPVAVNSDGIADLRADGRLAAVSVTFDAAATWSELKGAVVTGDVSGAR